MEIYNLLSTIFCIYLTTSSTNVFASQLKEQNEDFFYRTNTVSKKK